MNDTQSYGLLLGRVLLAFMFVTAGIGKLGDIQGTMAYTASAGIPGVLGVAAGVLEVLAGLAVIVGWQARWAALALAAFTAAAGYLFHYIPAQGLDGMEAMVQTLMFQKNLAIAGGFVVLAALGPGRLSLDARQRRAVAA
jgi:putative oxidoreductase